MTSLTNSLVLTKHSPFHISPGSPFKSSDQCLGSLGPKNLLLSLQTGKTQFLTSKRALTVQAGYSDGGKPGSTSIFIGGFVLGGILVGTLGCVYAPQKTRKVLAEKIAQLNSAIDDVSAQLRPEDDTPNGVAVDTDEVEAAI
ncbi:hypothetical protein TEA_022925 [Camellia sinensis var. sinensis]|uniref:Uncharacterized protein n=1 Tax=Camellia sinensis var. sinensis TaxID=542762 RepID=A0A4S4DVE7_CAMSN|nr:hypothetical protein TEA_022909 [Camellia sinensis var. sinensis]THG07010.1 hypothetical protein TEA_022925 [Camellia sinensis var. sinensis]